MIDLADRIGLDLPRRSRLAAITVKTGWDGIPDTHAHPRRGLRGLSNFWVSRIHSSRFHSRIHPSRIHPGESIPNPTGTILAARCDCSVDPGPKRSGPNGVHVVLDAATVVYRLLRSGGPR